MRPKLRLNRITDGLHPSEAAVFFFSKEGEEELVLDKSLIEDNSISVSVIDEIDDFFVVEFPRELSSGRWRALVLRDEIEFPKKAA